MNNTCVCILGKSCTGKSTIAKECKDRYNLKMVESYTTRPQRDNELEGHTFVTDDEFNKLENIVAYGEYGGYRYCATKEQIDTSDIYVVDLQGIKDLKEKYLNNENKKNIYVIYIYTSFVRRLIRSIRDNGLYRGIRRLIRDNGMFKEDMRILKGIPYSIYSNDDLIDRENIIDIINQFTKYS